MADYAGGGGGGDRGSVRCLVTSSSRPSLLTLRYTRTGFNKHNISALKSPFLNFQRKMDKKESKENKQTFRKHIGMQVINQRDTRFAHTTAAIGAHP